MNVTKTEGHAWRSIASMARHRKLQRHAFSIKTLLAEVNEAIDTGLWDTLPAIEERVMLLKQMTNLSRESGQAADAERIERQSKETEERLKSIRELVLDPSLFGH